MKIDADVTLTGGQLKAVSESEVRVLGAANGGSAYLIGKDAVLDLEGSTTTLTSTPVVFATGATGRLVLSNSARFASAVIGFGEGDSIDVRDIPYVPGHSRYDGPFLTVSDGIKSATITLPGNYDPDDFTFASDGHGGTLVTAPDAPPKSVIETSGADPGVVAGTMEVEGVGGGVGSIGGDVIEVFLGGVAHGGPGDTRLVLDVVAFHQSLNLLSSQPIPTDAPTNVTGLGSDNWIKGGPGNDTINGGGGDNIAAYSRSARHYTVTTKGNIITVEDRSGQDGTDTLINIQHLEFQGLTLDTALLTKATTVTRQQFQDLAALYVGYFDRAPDALGLDYWGGRLVDGMPLTEIARSFFVQAEAAAAYPPGTTPEALVAQVYRNAVGRAPDQAGLDYWLNDLDSGNLAPDMFVLAFINGARSATGSAADAQSLANKEAVGLHFALDRGLTNVAWGTQVMAHVDATAHSVAAAKQVTDAYAHQAVTTDPHLLLPMVGVHSDALVGA